MPALHLVHLSRQAIAMFQHRQNAGAGLCGAANRSQQIRSLI
jgi:hypothetical protein